MNMLVVFSRRFSVVCFFTISLLFFGSQLTSANTIESTDLEAFMDEVIEEVMVESHIPNATVSVVKDGEVIFEKGYGYANIEKQERVEPEKTMFRIGSVSKLFTWTAVMQLAEQGEVDLDTDINEYLDFEIGSTVKAGGEVEAEPITLHHLMTHTPGLEDYADSVFRLSAEQLLPLDEYVRQYLPTRIFPPGEVTAYSNYGTALAGYIVEQVSGIPFPEYVEENIYRPLGMKQSTFYQPVPEDLSSYLVQPYRFVDGEYREGAFEYVPVPAGAMSSTSADMAKFMMAYLQGGKNGDVQILEVRTVDQMLKQQFTQHPELDGMTLGFMEKTIHNERVLSHGGSTTLFDTGVYLLPDQNIGLFISYSGSSYQTHTDVFQKFMDRYFPPLQKGKTIAAEVASFDRSKKYVGEYHPNRKSFTTAESLLSLTSGITVEAEENGELLVKHNGKKNRFVETAEGIYLNTSEGSTPDAYGEFRTIVFGEDPFGNVMLASDGPMTYSKAPWYATSGITILSIIAGLLFFTISFIYWAAAFLMRIIRRKKSPYLKGAKIARYTVTLFGLLFLGLVASIAMQGIDPVYGLPKTAFGIFPSWSHLVDLFPYGMVILGIVMILFTVFAWRNKYWRITGRIHYTLLTMMAINIILFFWYWNLI